MIDVANFLATLNVVGETVLDWLGRALIYGTVLAAGTWLICRRLPRRLGMPLQGALWVVVLVKFLLPAGPGWSLSLASAGRAIQQRLVSPVAEAPAFSDTTEATAAPLIFAILETERSAPLPAREASSGGGAVRIPWTAILTLAYLTGVAAVAAVRINAYRRFARRCRALPLAPESARALVADVCRRLRVRRLPDVRLSDDSPAPYILGAVRPILVLSRVQLVRPDELEAVILHEIAHLRRRDLMVRYLQWIAGTLLFFWPVVAWVNRRVDLAREHACDDWALRHGRLAAGDYARCLLRAMHPAAERRGAFAPATMARSIKSVERRIEMIMDAKNRGASLRFLGVPAVGGFAAWCLFVLTGAAVPQTPPAGEPAQGEPGKAGEVRRVVVVAKTGENGEPVVVETIEGEHTPIVLKSRGALPQGAPGQVVVTRKAAAAAWVGAKPFAFKINEDFRAIAREHPTADANADGKVTREERDAFLAARAMNESAAVLEKFPAADRNKDGALDAQEAARLISHAGMQVQMLTDCPGEGKAAAVMVRERQEGDQVQSMRWVRAAPATESEPAPPAAGTDPAPVKQQVRMRMTRPAGGAMAGAFAARTTPLVAGQWVLENLKNEPTRTEVLRLLPIVREAPLAAFLEIHPEADANKDGKLTTDEQHVFMQGQMAKIRADILKSNPAADADADGVLSEEEFLRFTGECDVLKAEDGGVWVPGGHAPLGIGVPHIIQLNDAPDGEIHLEINAEVQPGEAGKVIQLKPVITRVVKENPDGDGQPVENIEIEIEAVEAEEPPSR